MWRWPWKRLEIITKVPSIGLEDDGGAEEEGGRQRELGCPTHAPRLRHPVSVTVRHRARPSAAIIVQEAGHTTLARLFKIINVFVFSPSNEHFIEDKDIDNFKYPPPKSKHSKTQHGDHSFQTRHLTTGMFPAAPRLYRIVASV